MVWEAVFVLVSSRGAIAEGGFTLGVPPGFGLHDPKANNNIIGGRKAKINRNWELYA
jgi:hypothetical protein